MANCWLNEEIFNSTSCNNTVCKKISIKLDLDMISNEEKYRLLEIARKYNVSKLYLFGSNRGKSFNDKNARGLSAAGRRDILLKDRKT